jgi:ketosteroid isomerase-like protein
MPRENFEVVRRAYESFNRWAAHPDVGPSLDTEAGSLLHPEVEFHTYANAPEAGVYRGEAAVIEYNQRLFEQFESLRIDVEELVDAGDRVIVVSTQHAIPKGGAQQEIHVHMVEVWTVRDGLLAERHSYSSKTEALEAMGLRE